MKRMENDFIKNWSSLIDQFFTVYAEAA